MKTLMRPMWAFVIYSALVIGLTYPLVLQLGSVLPHDAGDPALNTWILWWNAHALPYTSTWWNAPNFYPIPDALTFSEHLLGLSLFATPIQWLGFSPQVAYNVVFLLTFPLCAIGAYLLALELTGRDDAAFIAGLLFGFAPFRIAHLPQIQILAAFAMPFALLGLHRYLRDPRARWLSLFGASWLVQAICNGYYLLFFGVFVALWILWFASPLSKPRTFAAIAGTWVVASLPLIPLLLHYQSVHRELGFAREFGAIRFFGADVFALLNAAPSLRFWNWLHVYKRAEGELFPGLTIAVLVLVGAFNLRPHLPPRAKKWGIVRRVLLALAVLASAISISAYLVGPWSFRPYGVRIFSVADLTKPLTGALVFGIVLLLTSRRLRYAYEKGGVLGFYAAAAFLMWLFSLGPAPSLMGNPFMYRGPYALLMEFPGFNALRVPARFWMMTILSLAVIGPIAFDRLAPRAGGRRVFVATLISIGVLLDGWVTHFPLVPVPAPLLVQNCVAGGPAGAVIELPLGDPFRDVAAMYRGMSHGQPVVNGYSGYFPPHYPALRIGLDALEDDVLTHLARRGVSDVVINASDDPAGVWRRYVSEHQGAQVVCVEGRQTRYRLSAASDTTSQETATTLPITAIVPNVNEGSIAKMTDGDRTTRWESGPQNEHVVVEVDLGTIRSVTAIELKLGPFVEDFPRRLAIDVSEDGTSWREVWRGGSAGLAFVAASSDPSDVPLRYELGGARARRLRMRLLSTDETYYWSIAEMKVLGS